MKAVVAKADLLALIGKIQSIVSHKPAIPVLANILIEAIDDQIILNATDLTTSMRCFCEAKVIEEGAVALPGRRFFQLARELTAPQIKISCPQNDIAEITAGSSVFKINGVNKSEFPTLTNLANASQIPLSAAVLKEMLTKTAFSAAREDSRHVLNGIFVQILDKKASFISTDGKRLAKVHTEIDLDPSFQGSYILPLKAVEEMIKMLDENSSRTSLNLMRDKVCLENSNVVLITKLLSGQYPDVERVIPESTPIKVNLHREELISLLRQVALFTSEACGSIRFVFTEGQLDLIAVNSDIGEGNVNMPVDYKGDKLEVAFNPFYFLDILRHSKDETVTFAIQDAYNPGVITDSSTAKFVIMPMRLQEPAVAANVSEKPAFA